MNLPQFVDGLDLNRYEKEVVMFLSGVDNASANVVYKKTMVPKGRIYSVLNSLVEKGFVNIIPTSPKKYKIEDMKESLKNYLKGKRMRIDESIKEVENLEIGPKMFQLERNAPSVYSFTGREEHLNALISLRNKAKKRIIQVAPLFVGTFASNLALYKALNRGVRVSVITRKVTKENKKKIMEAIKQGAEVRYLDSLELVHFLIMDGKEFLLGLQDYRKKEERLTLYSKNQGLLIALENYFDSLWVKAHKIDVKKF